MSIQIHPYLLARLIAVQEAFKNPGYRPVVPKSAIAAAPKKAGNNWDAIIKKEDEGDKGEGGSGGTMKGYRGKQAEYAKAAMRKLARR